MGWTYLCFILTLFTFNLRLTTLCKVNNIVQGRDFMFYYLFVEKWVNHNERIDIFSLLSSFFLTNNLLKNKYPSHRDKNTSEGYKPPHPSNYPPSSPNDSLLHFRSNTTCCFILFFSLSSLLFLPSPSPTTTISPHLLPLLRRGRFFITLGRFLSRRDRSESSWNSSSNIVKKKKVV